MNNKLACLIPCFNESDNLKTLCANIEFNNNQNIDWYIINNGSNDISFKKFDSKIKTNIKSKNIKIFHIKKNNGYGHGIKECFKNISKNYDAICWTHADGQTPIKDVIKIYNLFINNPKYIFFKGKRISRDDGIISSTFTMFLNLILLLILNQKSLSPNSQPTLLKTNIFKSFIPNLENDGNFDISVMFLAKKLKIKPFRFPVEFKLRLSGKGSNESLNQKLNYSFKTLKYLFNQSFFLKNKSIF